MAGAPESTKSVIKVQLQAEFLHAGIVIARIIQSKVSDFFFDAILFQDSEHLYLLSVFFVGPSSIFTNNRLRTVSAIFTPVCSPSCCGSARRNVLASKVSSTKCTTMPFRLSRLLDVHKSKDKWIRLWAFASFALITLVCFVYAFMIHRLTENREPIFPSRRPSR